MSEDGPVQCSAGTPRTPRVRIIWNAVKRWAYLYIWCRYCYRHVMKFAHRFNWHYAPVSIMTQGAVHRDHWCQWCGLRGTTFHPTQATYDEMTATALRKTKP